MATAVTDLDPAAVTQNEELLAAWLAAEYPSLDLSAGRVLRDLLIRPAALLHTLNQTDVANVMKSQSLSAIKLDPASADTAVVDAVFSNYQVSRKSGTNAAGQLTIVVSAALTTAIGQAAVFSANGYEFQPTASFVGVTASSAVISTSQRLITRRADGTYAFVIDVQATAEGPVGIRRNTRFTVNQPISGLVDVFATADFTDGVAPETNAEMVAAFERGISPPVFSGRIQIDALLHETMPDLVTTSIVGYGDAEMLRDRNNLFGIGGGKADLYVRTALLPSMTTLTKEATLISAAGKTWQFSIAKDDAPGFYEVESVLPENSSASGSLEITAETRGVNLTATNEFVPDIYSMLDGAYTRYQTAVVQVYDPDTSTTGMTEGVTKRNFTVLVSCLPGLATLQSLASNRNNRSPNSDYLVRAPVPAIVTMDLTLEYAADVPDVGAIQTALAKAVNSLGITDRIPAALIHDTIRTAAGPDVIAVSPVDMFMRLRKPLGGYVQDRSANALTIPTLPGEGVSPRTTAFFLYPDSVSITLRARPAVSL